MKKVIKKIFNDIDIAIKNNISEKPIKIADSNFLKDYKKIKERYLHEI